MSDLTQKERERLEFLESKWSEINYVAAVILVVGMVLGAALFMLATRIFV